MTVLDSPTARATRPRLDRAGSLFMIVGGLAFFAYGPLHPVGSDDGDKVAQLHSMLVDAMWYPAHAAGLLAFSCIAAGILAIGYRSDLPPRIARLTCVVGIIGVVMAVGQLVHLFAATQASAIADGSTTPLVVVFTAVETVVNPVWSVAIATLALAGGITRTVGNRLVLVLGLVGGLAFAVANATIAFTDTFDMLFPVAGLVGVWCVAVGTIGLARR